MEAFEFSVHFMHGFIALLTCVALLPMILTTLLSNTFAKQLQKNLIYLLILNIIWNVLAFVEQLPRVYISDDVRYVIYILGSLCWVQYGYAVFRVICGIAGENISPAWKKLGFVLTIWDIFAVCSVSLQALPGIFIRESFRRGMALRPRIQTSRMWRFSYSSSFRCSCLPSSLTS